MNRKELLRQKLEILNELLGEVENETPKPRDKKKRVKSRKVKKRTTQGKLTLAQKRQLKYEALKNRAYGSAKMLGEKYGVHPSIIGQIRAGKAYSGIRGKRLLEAV